MFKFMIFGVCVALALEINGDLDFDIVKYGMCDGFPDTEFKVYANYTKINRTAIKFNADSTISQTVGENTMLHLKFDLFENDQWNTILNLDDKDPCKLCNDYVPDMWHELQGMLGMKVGECPIPGGKYMLHNYVLDMASLPMQPPLGKLRFQANATDLDRDEKLLLCLEGVFLIKEV